MDLADRYADRNPGGTYSTNLMQALWAVNCLDKPEPAGAEEQVAQQQRLTAQAPLWGRSWRVPSSARPGRSPTARRRRTRPHHGCWLRTDRGHRDDRDPATPYEVGGGPGRSAREGDVDHLRRGRPHGIHPLEPVSTMPSTTGSSTRSCRSRPALLTRFDRHARAARILVRRPRARLLSSVGQSDSLVMNRSSVRFRQEAQRSRAATSSRCRGPGPFVARWTAAGHTSHDSRLFRDQTVTLCSDIGVIRGPSG